MEDIFGDTPIILMANRSMGRTRYYGRGDIVDRLCKVVSDSIPLQNYKIYW
ncbi:MAG: hypothetical protein ACOYJD_01910 [Christensenellales bacterium]